MPDKKTEIEPLSLGIKKYTPLLYSFFARPIDGKTDLGDFKPEEVSFEINAQTKAEVETNKFLIHLTVEIYLDKEYKIGELMTQHEFVIDQLDNYVLPKADQTVQNGLSILLLGIAISTTRGILMVKGAGTPLQFYQATILPLVDATQMLQAETPESETGEVFQKKPTKKKTTRKKKP